MPEASQVYKSWDNVIICDPPRGRTKQPQATFYKRMNPLGSKTEREKDAGGIYPVM